MENEVLKSTVPEAKDAHVEEDASRNGNVTLKALDAYSLKRIEVCNCVYWDPGKHSYTHRFVLVSRHRALSR